MHFLAMASRRRARARGAARAGDLLRGAQGTGAGGRDAAARAPALRPGDPKPLQRLSDLYLRQGEWKPRGRGAAGVGAALPRRRRARGAAPAHRIDPPRSGARRARARRRPSGAPPSSIPLGTARARWSRCTRRRGRGRRARDGRSRDRRRPAGARRRSARRAAAGTAGRVPGDGAQPRARPRRSPRRRRRSRACLRSGDGDGVGRGRRRAAPGRSRPRWRARVLGGAGASGRGRLRRELWPNLVEAALELFPRAARARAGGSRSLPAPSSWRGSRPARRRSGSPGCTSRCTREPGGAPVVALEEPAARCCCSRATSKIRSPSAFRSGGRSASWRCARRCSSASVPTSSARCSRAPRCWRASRRPPGSRSRRTSCCARSPAPSAASSGRR